MSTMRVHNAGLDGEFGCPVGEGPFRAVLALGGSEGGIPRYSSACLSLMASRVSPLPTSTRRIHRRR